MKRLFAAVLLLVFVGVGAWVVATKVESPDQVAARAEAPVPDPIVAALHRGFLQGPVSLSTTAQLERTVTLKPPASLTGVVTFTEKAIGSTLTPGSVLLRANGRPVFVLPGSFALYRDLRPGDMGDDVAALQGGLRTAGHGTGRDRAGTYGAGTQAAVRAMYKAAGYTAPEITPNATPDASDDIDVPAATTKAPATSPNTAGPQVLTTEVMTVADLPAVVEAVAPVGTQLTGDTDLVTLGAGELVLSATLPTSSLGALAVGATGAFTDDAGNAGTARVTTLTVTPEATDTVVALSATGVVSPGRSYVISFDNPAAETGQTLLAPIAAVVNRAGRSYVYSWNGATFQEVEVSVIGSVGGVAGIVPIDTAVPLDDGTEVRIG